MRTLLSYRDAQTPEGIGVYQTALALGHSAPGVILKAHYIADDACFALFPRRLRAYRNTIANYGPGIIQERGGNCKTGAIQTIR